MQVSPSRVVELECPCKCDDVLTLRRFMPVERRTRRRLLEVQSRDVGGLAEGQRSSEKMRGIVGAGEKFERIHGLIIHRLASVPGQFADFANLPLARS